MPLLREPVNRFNDRPFSEPLLKLPVDIQDQGVEGGEKNIQYAKL